MNTLVNYLFIQSCTNNKHLNEQFVRNQFTTVVADGPYTNFFWQNLTISRKVYTPLALYKH